MTKREPPEVPELFPTPPKEGEPAAIYETRRDPETGIVYTRQLSQEDALTVIKNALRENAEALNNSANIEAAKQAAENLRRTIAPVLNEAIEQLERITSNTSEELINACRRLDKELEAARKRAEIEIKFREKELKKKYYQGKTYLEILSDHTEKILTLSDEEQEAATQEDGSILVPGTMYEHYRRALIAHFDKLEAAPAYTLRNPAEMVIPFDKVTSALFNEKNPDNLEEVSGGVNIEGKAEREQGTLIRTNYTLRSVKGALPPSLNKKDLVFLLYIDAIYAQAIKDGIPKDEVKLTPYKLAQLVYRTDRPNDRRLNEVKEQVEKLQTISVVIDNAEEAEARGKKYMARDIIYLMPCEIVDGYIHILQRPRYISQYLLGDVGQYSTIKPALLNVPISYTETNCAIICELLRNILGNFTPKDAKTGETVISLSHLWERCGISGGDKPAERTRRAKLKKETIEPLLKSWSEEHGLIGGFRFDRTNIYIKKSPKRITGEK